MATFSDSLFAASHVLRLSRSSLTRSLIKGMDLAENDMLVSSAYMLTCDCDKYLISLWKLVKTIKDDLFLFIHEKDEIECYINDEQSFHEGYVISNKYGTHKVVDREVFSHANFTIAKNW